MQNKYYQTYPHTDPDDTDAEPSDEMMKLYMYKLDQLEEILSRVYDEEDVKRVSAKLQKAERGKILVIYYMYL